MRISPEDARWLQATPLAWSPTANLVWWTVDQGRQARLEELISVARGIQSEINHGEVGRVEEVLIEKAARERGLKRITADFVEQVKKKEMG